jgi:hypothetical protein
VQACAEEETEDSGDDEFVDASEHPSESPTRFDGAGRSTLRASMGARLLYELDEV